jgi:hypothetical protein
MLVSLLATAMVVFSMQAMAESQLGGRNFNHMTTGFPLSGGHAAAACETCHTGGVFKGTPRNCDGCHATGKRIVATPKSTSHIVTDAACESCHFNSATWLGARYNHGTAKPGQCATCHNGRISAGKPASHSTGSKATDSCDSCHRTIAWLPANWNHTDLVSDCVVCHKAGGPGRNFTSSAKHAQFTAMGISTCKTCHYSYYSFPAVFYNHSGASTACETCHNNPAYSSSVAQLASIAKHNIYSTAGISNCQSCHKSYARGSFPSGRYDHVAAGACNTCHKAAFSPTIRAMAGNHIPILVTATCTSCHYSATSWAAERMAHDANQVSLYPCTTCHLRGNAYLGRMEKQNLHELDRNPGATDCSSNGCHLPGGVGPTGKSAKGVLYQKWD